MRYCKYNEQLTKLYGIISFQVKNYPEECILKKWFSLIKWWDYRRYPFMYFLNFICISFLNRKKNSFKGIWKAFSLTWDVSTLSNTSQLGSQKVRIGFWKRALMWLWYPNIWHLIVFSPCSPTPTFYQSSW